MRSFTFGVAAAALMVLTACGGDETGSPPPTGGGPTPTPTATSTTSSIPARTLTTQYDDGFTPSMDRTIEGFIQTVGVTPTGGVHANGQPVTTSSAIVSRQTRGGGVGFTASMRYFEADKSVDAFNSGSSSVQLFDGDATAFRSTQNFVEWTQGIAPSYSNTSLRWLKADTVRGATPRYYSFVTLRTQFSDGSESATSFIGGSNTTADDLPPSGQESQLARMLANSFEPGDGSYGLRGNADLRIDYSAGTVTGTFDLVPTQGSLAQPITVRINGRIEGNAPEFRYIVGESFFTGSNSPSGEFGGSFFGPYGEEVAISVAFRTPSGQDFFGEIEARRK